MITISKFIRRMSSLQSNILSAKHRGEDIWKSRSNCKLLSDVNPDTFFQDILSKLGPQSLINALDLDIFINSAKPVLHLEESVHLLGKFRKSIAAHTVLDSTHHALCRLFLDSNQIYPMMAMIEDRVNYGIFPDLYTINILINDALEKGNLALASRIAALCMIQEEFGENELTDKLSFLAISKYLVRKPDFSDWKSMDFNQSLDEILGSIAKQTEVEETSKKDEVESTKTDEDVVEEDEEDEEDAEYIRIPFLKNDYFDDHFDLKEPNHICGKTLSLVSSSLVDKYSLESLGYRGKLLALILYEKWQEVEDLLNTLPEKNQKIDQTTADLSRHYLNREINLKNGLTEDTLKRIVEHIDKNIAEDLNYIGQDMEILIKKEQTALEERDLEWFKNSIQKWSLNRDELLKVQMDKIIRTQKLKDIEDKMKELNKKEKYLYYLDELHKKKVTRIKYE